jgi:hypothetical protein
MILELTNLHVCVYSKKLAGREFEVHIRRLRFGMNADSVKPDTAVFVSAVWEEHLGVVEGFQAVLRLRDKFLDLAYRTRDRRGSKLGCIVRMRTVVHMADKSRKQASGVASSM